MGKNVLRCCVRANQLLQQKLIKGYAEFQYCGVVFQMPFQIAIQMEWGWNCSWWQMESAVLSKSVSWQKQSPTPGWDRLVSLLLTHPAPYGSCFWTESLGHVAISGWKRVDMEHGRCFNYVKTVATVGVLCHWFLHSCVYSIKWPSMFW